MSVWAVFVAALATAMATGLGALPFLLFTRPNRSSLGAANSLAAGAMAGASAGLLWEGWQGDPPGVVLGLAAGALFIALTRRILEHDGERHFGAIEGADAIAMLLIVGVMTIHSFTEGIGVGVAFGTARSSSSSSRSRSPFTTSPKDSRSASSSSHEGSPSVRAAAWSVSRVFLTRDGRSRLLFVESFEPLLPAGLGFTAGAMAWMVAEDLFRSGTRDPGLDRGRRGGCRAAAMLALQASLL